jgi:hypothetical protein
VTGRTFQVHHKLARAPCISARHHARQRLEGQSRGAPLLTMGHAICGAHHLVADVLSIPLQVSSQSHTTEFGGTGAELGVMPQCWSKSSVFYGDCKHL